MKTFKSVQIFSNGSFIIQLNSIKKSNKPIFKKIYDKNCAKTRLSPPAAFKHSSECEMIAYEFCR